MTKPPLPKWLANPNADRARKSRKQEERIATKLDGQRIPRSGGLPWSRWNKTKTSDGDVTTKDFQVEHKSTEKASISLKREWLRKIVAGARSCMKDPALVITFTEPAREPEDWVVIPMAVFQRMRAAIKEEDDG